jgi:hypothetical protein
VAAPSDFDDLTDIPLARNTFHSVLVVQGNDVHNIPDATEPQHLQFAFSEDSLNEESGSGEDDADVLAEATSDSVVPDSELGSERATFFR